VHVSVDCSGESAAAALLRDITYSSSEEEEEEEEEGLADPDEVIDDDASGDLSVEPTKMQTDFVIPDEIDEAGEIVGGPNSDIQVTHPMIRRKISTTARALSVMKPGGRQVNSSVLALQLLGTPDVDARIDGVITRGTHQSKSTGEFRRFCVCFFSAQDRNDEEQAQFLQYWKFNYQRDPDNRGPEAPCLGIPPPIFNSGT